MTAAGTRWSTGLRIAALTVVVLAGVVAGIWLATGRDDDSSRAGTGDGVDTVRTTMLPSRIGGSIVTSAAINGQGAIALATAAGSVRVMPPGQKPVDQVVARGQAILALALSEDSSTVAGLAGNDLVLDLVWAWGIGSTDVRSVRLDDDFFPAAVAISRDGSRFAAGTFDTEVFDLGTTIVAKTLIESTPRPGGSSALEALVFNQNADRLVAAAIEGVDVWDAEKGSRVGTQFDCPSCDANGVSLSRDGRFAAFGTGDAHVLVFDLSTGKLVFDRTVSALQGNHVYAATVTSDGTRVAAGAGDGLIVIYDRRTGSILNRLRLRNQSVKSLSFSDDGRTLLVEEQIDGENEWGEEDRWIVKLP